MSNINNADLDKRISAAVDECNELAEYWTNTVTEKLINNHRMQLVGALLEKGYEAAAELLPEIEANLARYRAEMERIENV